MVSAKLSERLIQLYILHRAYLTPVRLSRYWVNYSPLCPRCGENSGTFYHLLWSCPTIQGYWAQVALLLHDRMDSRLSLCPKQCLRGSLPNPDTDRILLARVFHQHSRNGWLLLILHFHKRNEYMSIEVAQLNITKFGTDGYVNLWWWYHGHMIICFLCTLYNPLVSFIWVFMLFEL